MKNRVVTWFSAALLTLSTVMPSHAILSPTDQNALSTIQEYMRKGKFEDALISRKRLKNKSAQDYVYWKYLTDPNTEPSYQKLSNFFRQNPRLPRHHIIQKKLEELLKTQNAQTRAAFFKAYQPISIAGYQAEIAYLFSNNQKSKAKTKLKSLWHHKSMPLEAQSQILSKYRHYFTKADHSARIRMLMDQREYSAANKLLGYAYDNDRVRYNIRKSLNKISRQALRAYNQAPQSVRQDAGVLRSLVYYYRKTDQDQKAIQTMLRLTTQQAKDNPKAWYTSRSILSRVAFKAGQKKAAYDMIANHQLSSGGPYVDAEFYAGWLALRHLGNSQTALQHFYNGRNKSSMPISISRFEYWVGRACDSLNRTPCSIIAYNNASQYFYTFYGQLAAYQSGNKKINIQEMPKASKSIHDVFYGDKNIQFAYAAHAAGNETDVRLFLSTIAKRDYKDGYVYKLLEEVTQEIGDLKTQVKLGKYATYNNHFLFKTGYPVLQATLSRNAPETALVYALTRQESEYDTSAVSRANAYGLMQLLPRTAKQTARKIGQPYKLSYLTKRPDYNLKLGSAYLGELVQKFNGSYIQALSGYNAGPSRVTQWNQSYGNYKRNLDQIIDRIETIPFSETRNYVQRILETLQIYRARLSGKNYIKPENLVRDLTRGI